MRVAATAGIRPLVVPIPVLTPSLSSHWIRLVTRADFTIARQLVDGLTADLVATGDDFWSAHPHLQRTPLDGAIRRALENESETSMPPWQRRWESIVSQIAIRA
jgi:hypothetical protein